MSESLLAAQVTSGALADPDPAATPLGTAGGTASMAMAPSSDSEPGAPGRGRVSVAVFPAWSRMVPPARASALVPVTSRAGVRSPDATVYENVRLGVPDPLR